MFHTVLHYVFTKETILLVKGTPNDGHLWNAIPAISGHLVVCWVDFSFGVIIIPNDEVDLRYCLVQKALHVVIISFRLLQ